MTFPQFTNILKDYTGIILAITGTVVTILTYLRAKETLLQPVRTEVIKKQTDLLIELLSLVGDRDDLVDKIDYHGIIQVNILSSMLLCGTKFENEAKVWELIKTNTRLEMLDLTVIQDSLESVPVFEEQSAHTKKAPDNKQYRDSALQGSFKMPSLKLTNKMAGFTEDLQKLKKSPFIPNNIKRLIESLLQEIDKNLIKHLKPAVEDSVNEAFKTHIDQIPSVDGVFNKFNHTYVRHEEKINRLREEIRKYLKIDSMP